MERVEFNLLKAEVNAQIDEIKQIYKDIEDREKGSITGLLINEENIEARGASRISDKPFNKINQFLIGTF